MADQVEGLEYMETRRLEAPGSDYQILQVLCSRPDTTIHIYGPNPAGNYMLVFEAAKEWKEELEVVLRGDQLHEIGRVWGRHQMGRPPHRS